MPAGSVLLPPGQFSCPRRGPPRARRARVAAAARCAAGWAAAGTTRCGGRGWRRSPTAMPRSASTRWRATSTASRPAITSATPARRAPALPNNATHEALFFRAERSMMGSARRPAGATGGPAARTMAARATWRSSRPAARTRTKAWAQARQTRIRQSPWRPASIGASPPCSALAAAPVDLNSPTTNSCVALTRRRTGRPRCSCRAPPWSPSTTTASSTSDHRDQQHDDQSDERDDRDDPPTA